MTPLNDMLDNLKDCLLAGQPPDAALAECVHGSEVTLNYLRNRAVAALGDLSTYAARTRPVLAAREEAAQEGRRTVALSILRDRGNRHNACRKIGNYGHPDYMSAERCAEFNRVVERLHGFFCDAAARQAYPTEFRELLAKAENFAR